MALKRITESPSITDQIIFDIRCPNIDGQYDTSHQTYKVSRVIIFYLERDFGEGNHGEYHVVDPDLQQQYDSAKEAASENPTTENLQALARLQQQVDLSKQNNYFFYKEAKPIEVIGTTDFPAWLVDDDPQNCRLIAIDEDADGNPQYGKFELHWTPLGAREGDYFICWSWTPNAGGDALTAHEFFTLRGNTQITTSIPAHLTVKDKYDILLDRYLPEMFKNILFSGDLTPKVLHEFNKAVAKGFTFLEDMTNQMVDLLDANTTHESFLPLLAGLFRLNLRSNDPTQWRRQIKSAIPLFKKKGTVNGLKEALSQAGVRLNKLTRLWQVISDYTWQEIFTVNENYQSEFTLSKTAILPVDLNNFELYHRAANSDTWVALTSDYVNLTNNGTVTTVSWVGDQLSYDPVELLAGDSIRILYQIKVVPSVDEQTIEDYVRTLPLADMRDERDQTYPLKNWNVRLIEEDDPYFDVVIPTRHPYADPLVWGWVRTEFPYSENIYNMEEYNGSIRESLNPCDIDKNFLDLCKYGQSSQFNVDVEIQQLSDHRIQETSEIIQEFVPFHSLPHTMYITGGVEEFVSAGVEDIETLISVFGNETTISGNGQLIFNRIMEPNSQLRRDALADENEVANASGIAFNKEIALFSPDVKLDELGLGENNVLEVLSPGPPWVTKPEVNGGTYWLSNANNYYAVVHGNIPLPIDSRSFAFRLSNLIYTNNNVNIYQEFLFSDGNTNFKTLWTNSNPGSEYDGSWTIQLAAYPHDAGDTYSVIAIREDGKLLLDTFTPTNHTLPSIDTTSINYVILKDATTLASGSAGLWTKGTRALVDVSQGTTLTNIQNIVKIGNYLVHDNTQYQICAFSKNSNKMFYIDGYTAGNGGTQSIKVYDRLVDTAIGYFHYRGMQLLTSTNYEETLEIVNGQNPPAGETFESDTFKEDLILAIINPLAANGEDYYSISDINGTLISLNGPYRTWGLQSEISVDNVDFRIIKIKQTSVEPIEIAPRVAPEWPGHEFRYLDRRGNEVIEVHNSESGDVTGLAMASVLNNETVDTSSQKESITLKIEWFDEENNE